MLSKEEFVSYIKGLQEFYKMTDEIYGGTQKHFDLLEFDEVSQLIENQLDLIEKLMECETFFIGDWFYNRNSKLTISEIEEFYDKLKAGE